MSLDLALALRRHLLERFPPDRAYPRAAFHAEGMPSLIAAFLDRALDRWVEIERTQFRSEWFDYDDVRAQQTEDAFFDALRHVARIPESAWTDTLGGSVDLVVRFLTMPARALTDAIFEGKTDPLPTAEVRTRLPMFDAYPYLVDVALAYLDRKQPDTLTPASLFALLDRIDRRVVLEHGLSDWLALLGPLFQLADHAGLTGLPTDLLQRFFAAKGADDLAARVADHDEATLDAVLLRDLLAPAFPDAPASDALQPRHIDEDENPRPTEAADAPKDDVTFAHALIDDEETAPPPDDAADTASEEAEDASYAHASDLPPVELTPLGEDLQPEDVSQDEDADDEDADDVTEEDSPAVAEEDEENVHEPLSEDESEAQLNDASTDQATSDAEPAALPLWQRFAAGSDGDSVNARFGTSEPEDHVDEEASGAVPLWKRFFSRTDADAASPEAEAPTEALAETPAEAAPYTEPARPADTLDALERRVLSPMPPSQRKRFVKHLFNGDAGKYATVLHALDRADSWTEASQIIARDVFRPSRVNIYGEHAVAFTDAVEARYRD